MPDEANALKEIALRLERLEKSLDTVPRRAPMPDVSAEELKAYTKVRAALAFEWGSCGINETSPCVVACRVPTPLCRPVPVCRACDFECTCGPCAQCFSGGGAVGGSGRFGGLGG